VCRQQNVSISFAEIIWTGRGGKGAAVATTTVTVGGRSVSRQQNVSISFAEKVLDRSAFGSSEARMVSLRMLRCDVFGAETENGVF
jgi:hypothetical protein